MLGVGVNVSVGIMAHPRRNPYVRSLLRGQLPVHTRVAFDKHNNPWETGRRAILSYLDQPDYEYHLVLQDDAILPPRFMAGVRNALEAIPRNSPLVLFTTKSTIWKPTLDAIPDSVSYLVMDHIWWGVGIVYPTHSIPDLITHCDQLSTHQYDHRVGDFYASNSIPVYYTWPNLLNHRAGPSLIPGRSGRRRAHNYSPSPPVDQLKWDGKVVKVTPPDKARLKL